MHSDSIIYSPRIRQVNIYSRHLPTFSYQYVKLNQTTAVLQNRNFGINMSREGLVLLKVLSNLVIVRIWNTLHQIKVQSPHHYDIENWPRTVSMFTSLFGDTPIHVSFRENPVGESLEPRPDFDKKPKLAKPRLQFCWTMMSVLFLRRWPSFSSIGSGRGLLFLG